MIYLENISKTFESKRGKVEALTDVNFQAKEGEFIVIKGPSGSGKTTLLLTIGGILRPTSGVIKLDNINIYSLKPKERTIFRAASIGFVFQMFYLLPYINVIENIMLSPDLSRDKLKREKALALANDLKLTERLIHFPSELSAGECQRVSLARALVHQPKILLADEPTGNLDYENSLDVVRIIKSYNQQGGTVFFVTHNNITDPFADKIFYIKNGKISGIKI